jgi:uncharacterized membrane protein YkvA (DUF1232 family)
MVEILRAWALRLRECTLVVYFIARNPRTPMSVRVLAACIAAYALSPIDLIPDFIPVLGMVDDLLLIPLGLALVLRITPREIQGNARDLAKGAASRASYAGAALVAALWISMAVIAMAVISRPAFPAEQPATLARIAELEDRESIRLLLRDYGRLLDERRFDEFGQLFAPDGEYVSAGTTMRGPTAIAESLRRIMAGNPLGLAEPNYHVLFNDRIELHGDRAESTSQSFFVAPGVDGAPRIVMMGNYQDRFVRTQKGWRFARRTVLPGMAPRPAPRAN